MKNNISNVFKRSIAAIAVTAVLSITSTVYADTGALKFQVTDSSGNPVLGAVVKVSTATSLTKKNGVTDENGFVRVVGLEPSTKYVIDIKGDEYLPFKQKGVKVVSGKSFSLAYTLRQKSNVEVIEVIGSANKVVIDTTSSVISTDITLDLTESLPTGRSYQSYLQLAPGTKPTLNGNPSSKSGVNYSDAVDSKGNTSGSSTDNIYYIDSINVTDGHTGGFGANFNSEIILEQQVITGGIPAEYQGGSGLVSRVVTKSGSNEFHGSINYYLQNDSLVADNDHLGDNSFSTYDAAVTLGGPIIKDQLWFFASYQVKNREDDVSDATSGELMRTVSSDSDLGFAKVTWQASENDKLVFTYFNDPQEIDGSKDPTVLNNRDQAQMQGGDNYKFEYSHMWDDFILTFSAYSHEGELSSTAADKTTRNDVAYSSGDPSLAELNRGGRGSDSIQFRNRESLQLTLEYFLDTDSFGYHAFKAGVESTDNTRKLNSVYTGDSSQYTSISGISSLDNYVNGAWTGATDIVSDDYNRIISAMEGSSNYADYQALLDVDNNGTISETELSTLQFNNTSGNPDGLTNVYRISQVQTAPVEFKTEGKTFFFQDSWTYNNLTLNAGIRAEQWEHFATNGDSIFTFDWDIAPRISAVYDINDDGESKVWAFYGRYYDPIRTDMTSFAGTLTGPVREEQVNVNGDWLTYRTRGGSQSFDAFFAPTTKTPYTDEFVIGYSQTISDSMSIEAIYTNRVSEDILEDYDLHLYNDSLQGTDFEIPLSYFGYDEVPESNYVIGTLLGGKREYEGYELIFKKARTEDDNYQILSSYTYQDAYGNSNSDGNADFQGDVVWLDPRAPGMWGKQPGNIDHLFKIAGTYFFDNGIEIGAVYNWNSGIRYSETWSVAGRHLPIRVDTAYESGGTSQRWVDADSVGTHTANSYGTLDLRVKYTYMLDDTYKAEFFLDIFNALDDQAAARQQDLQAGDGVYAFGEASQWVEPRRIYLGARMSF